MRVRLTTTEVRQLRETGSHQAGQRTTDDGLTIVELIIALVLVMIVFAALAATLISAFSAQRSNEIRVRATALANEAIEEMSTIPWASLGLYVDDDDLPDFVDDDGEPIEDATFEDELIVLLESDEGPVPAHRSTVTIDTRGYTITRWITWVEEPDDEADEGVLSPDLRRMIAIVSWEVGGTERSIRTDGVRSPNPDDLRSLEITFDSILPSRVLLRSPSEESDQFTNDGAFEAWVTVGEIPANHVLTFRDRDGVLRTITSPDSGDGDDERFFTIGNNAFRFPHGAHTFTVTATGDGGEVSSDSESMNFYQDLQVRPFDVTQVGNASDTIEVCRNGDEFVLEGDVVVEVDVWGLTPAEALEEEDDGEPALTLTWQPGSGPDEGFLEWPEEEVGPMQPTDLTRTVDGGSYVFDIEEDAELDLEQLLLPLLEALGDNEHGTITFRVRADRRVVDAGNVLLEDFSDLDFFDVSVPVEDVCYEGDEG